MTEDQRNLAENACGRTGTNDDRVAVTVHRDLHEAALHLAQHHIAAYAGHVGFYDPDHAHIDAILVGVAGGDPNHMDLARTTAHKLAEQIAPSMVNGHPARLMIVVSEGPMTVEDLEAVMTLLHAV